jgi:lysyl-tRNA synthetase class 2
MLALRQRADILAKVRQFFAARNVLEVSTPMMGNSGPRDLYLQLVQASFGAEDEHLYYLQPSPESAMKRLLAAGSGAIYQLGPALRAAERGRRHNPEFTMLEWYRPGYTLLELMDEVEALLKLCLGTINCRRTSYRAEFMRHVGLDPFDTTHDALAIAAAQLAGASDCNDDQLLDFLFNERVEPALGDGIVYVLDFPPEQAAMAQIAHGVAQRFEVYVDGMELANGYLELTDETELRQRFEQQGRERRQLGLHVPPLDEALLMAIRHGLSPMSGVALGVDRLVMLVLGARNIDEVLAFPLERA